MGNLIANSWFHDLYVIRYMTPTGVDQNSLKAVIFIGNEIIFNKLSVGNGR